MKKLKFFDNIYFLSALKKVNVVLFGVLATIFINRLLGPELKGEYEYIHNIITLLTAILNLGISLVLPNYVRKKENGTFSTFYALSIIQFVVYFLMSIIVGIIMKSPKLFLYGMVVSLGVLSLQLLNFSMVYNFKVSVLANCISVFINALILGAAFICDVSNVTFVFVVLAVKEGICSLLCAVPLAKDFNIKDVEFKKWKKIIAIGFIPMVTSLLSIMNYKVDVLELKWLGIDNYYIGIYSVGLNLAEYVLLLSDIFRDVLFNKTSKKDDVSSMKLCIRVCSTVMIAFFIVVIIGGKLIINILYGAEFVAAYKVTVLVVFGVYSMMFFKLLGVLYIAQGKWRFYFLVLSGSVAINIISNLILIPFLSIYGAAITSVLSYFFAGAVFAGSFMKSYHIKFSELFFITKEDFSNLVRYLRK